MIVEAEPATVYRFRGRRSLTKTSAYRRAADAFLRGFGCTGDWGDETHEAVNEAGETSCQYHNLGGSGAFEYREAVAHVARLLRLADDPRATVQTPCRCHWCGVARQTGLSDRR